MRIQRRKSLPAWYWKGDTACPFTTPYWDFLARHEGLLAKNPRMALQVKNMARLSVEERAVIVQRAGAIRRGEVAGT